MKITLFTVGSLKEKYLREGCGEYEKRLKSYVDLTIRECKDLKAPERLSDKEKMQLLDREGEPILNRISPGDYVVALDIDGKAMDSVTFSEKIREKELQGTRSMVFVIGGSLGLSEKILARADFRLSFSPMTFPHQLMRLIFLEQLYRAYRIKEGHSYHK